MLRAARVERPAPSPCAAPQRYAGRLPIDETARLILQGIGGRGHCREYLANTVRHLEQLGLVDGPLPPGSSPRAPRKDLDAAARAAPPRGPPLRPATRRARAGLPGETAQSPGFR